MASIPGKLSLSIGLNTKPLGKDLVIAQNQLKGFDGNLKGMASQFNASFTKARKPIQGTTMAVTNFNRIVQDAPFGLMGISNNIEPMIQSFNKLRSQTGSVTKALTTLGASMFTGPGALITVASLATTAFLTFGDKLGGIGDKAEEVKDKVKGFTSELNRLVESSQDGLFGGDSNTLEAVQDRISKIQLAIAEINNLEKIRRENLPDNLYKESEQTVEEIKQLQEELVKLKAKEANIQRVLSLDLDNQLSKMQKIDQIEQQRAERAKLQTSFSENIGRANVGAVTDLGENNPIDIILNKIPIAQQKMEEFTQLQIAQAQALAQGFDRVFDSFARTFVDGLTDLKNFGDAWKTFGKSVVSALKEIAAQLMKMALIRGIGSILFPSAGTLLTGFDLASQIIGGGGANKSRSAGKMAINSNLFIDGQQLQTQQKFTSYRSNQLGFG